jgi:hypothetical protein
MRSGLPTAAPTNYVPYRYAYNYAPYSYYGPAPYHSDGY